ncbi:MAG: DDE-type integrase/transposase/recombinase, partial [Myxococcales bacterium]|nr:DDE-type integrase/transposase/recombinase [Myxococcales bacterium]
GVYQASKLYELLPKGPNELWQMDVTYIHIAGYGWRYGVTVIDYYSRYLLAATLTASYSAHEVTRVLEAVDDRVRTRKNGHLKWTARVDSSRERLERTARVNISTRWITRGRCVRGLLFGASFRRGCG